jgi:hypothetical protein
MNNIIRKFKDKYKNFERYGLVVADDIINIEGVNFININYPFIFDRRWLPKTFEGFGIRGGVNSSDLPEEFQIDESELDWYKKSYVWAPERFEKFVDRCADEIRQKLDNNNMTREEMLDALCFGDFEKHKKTIKEKILKGELPEYREC